MVEEKYVVDITGRRYGKLVVVGFSHYAKHNSYWLCKCDCGGEKVVKRRLLQAGNTKSCGCLLGAGLHRVDTTPTRLAPEKQEWLIKNFKHTKNADILVKLGISEAYLHRFARRHGLKKSPQFMRKTQMEAAAMAVKSHIKNGTYPKKGYRIPRSEEFYFNGTRKETEEQKKARMEKARQTRNRIIREDRARIHFGLPQRSRIKLNRQNRNIVNLRHNLRGRGYIIERGSMTVYYDEHTKRSPRIEARKNGDVNYVAFRYLPISEKRDD